MFIDFLLEVFAHHHAQDAIIWKGQVRSYAWLQECLLHWQRIIQSEEVAPGTVAVLQGDFSPNSVALFLALVDRGCIVVPLTSPVEAARQRYLEIAQGEVRFLIDEADKVEIVNLNRSADHALYGRLRQSRHPGLVLFSSGSTGAPKGIVHDLLRILEKFKAPRRRLKSITFLLYDHIGGLNTMLYTLSNGGCMVVVEDRNPETVLAAVEKYRVDLIPASPTFVNLVLVSEAYKRYDLSSLKTVTYGTEVMAEIVLKRFHEILPNVQLLQTYGLSELGILRSKSQSSDSLWVKVGGEGVETRVVEGVLHIRSKSAMLGYLNAPDPFTDDGWLNTEDSVEQSGDYIRFLGRKSEVINVGGEKVYPAEVESVIQEIYNVGEVTVYAERNAILGNIVCAKVTLLTEEDSADFLRRLKKYCGERLPRYKIPVRVEVTADWQHGSRFKKIRVT